MKDFLRDLFTENVSYKLMALFITLVLWFTILGRRDFVFTANIDIDLRAVRGTRVVMQSAEKLRVRLSGPRTALKRFMENPANQALIIDLSGRREGVYDLEVPVHRLDVPMGVKILSSRPTSLRIELAPEAESGGAVPPKESL